VRRRISDRPGRDHRRSPRKGIATLCAALAIASSIRSHKGSESINRVTWPSATSPERRRPGSTVDVARSREAPAAGAYGGSSSARADRAVCYYRIGSSNPMRFGFPALRRGR